LTSKGIPSFPRLRRDDGKKLKGFLSRRKTACATTSSRCVANKREGVDKKPAGFVRTPRVFLLLIRRQRIPYRLPSTGSCTRGCGHPMRYPLAPLAASTCRNASLSADRRRLPDCSRGATLPPAASALCVAHCATR